MNTGARLRRRLAEQGKRLPLLGNDDDTANRQYTKHFALARDRARGQAHGLEYRRILSLHRTGRIRCRRLCRAQCGTLVSRPSGVPNDILKTSLLLRQPAGRRGSVGGIRQHAVAEDAGIQIPERETELRRDRLRRPGRQQHPRRRAHGEHRCALRCRRPPRRRHVQAVSQTRRSTEISGRCWTRKARTSTPSSSPRRTTCTRPPPCGAWSAASTSTCRSRWCAPSGKPASCARRRAKYRVATQMGNQGYSNEGTRQCAEIIWTGEIGNVTEVHAWSDRPLWPQGLTEIPAGGSGALHARLGPLARHRRQAPLHRRRQDGTRPLGRILLSAVQLARLLRFRLRRARRHGVPHPRRSQHGAATFQPQAHERRVHQEGRREPLHVPEGVGHPVRLRARTATCPR